jgi:manganese/zinc/iron transport system permease protein
MMASMTGVFLLLAFIFSPRYGLITQELRRAGQRRENAERMLLVHLYNHEGDRAQKQENAQPALESHLRWDAAKAEATLQRGIGRGLIKREGQGGMLYLTEAGRALAREVLEPWTATR